MVWAAALAASTHRRTALYVVVGAAAVGTRHDVPQGDRSLTRSENIEGSARAVGLRPERGEGGDRVGALWKRML